MSIWSSSGSKSLISFETIYDSAFSFILIILIVALLIYLIRKVLIPKKSEFYSQEYWESRYSIFSKKMDWYCEFDKLSNDFKISDLLDSLYPKKNKTKVLELGCGNSSLAYDLLNLGFRKITSIDFSSVVIKSMKEKYKGSVLECNFF
jgi:2-polyprenyl-3-methyl-5-hydroxy-6-metoxy-1,4-benzoquinol methylase